MIVNTPISLGELIDKISILRIKKNNIMDQKKLKHIDQELTLLDRVLSDSVSDKKINEYLKELVEVNALLWTIEDKIRECEKKNQFDENFINLARSVYQTNDKRAKIKLEINNYTRSKIKEVKEYTNY